LDFERSRRAFEPTHQAWLFTLDVHLRAAGRHEACAELLAKLGNAVEAEYEVERAARERSAHAAAVAQHPDRVY
jgi:hypothetical protein